MGFSLAPVAKRGVIPIRMGSPHSSFTVNVSILYYDSMYKYYNRPTGALSWLLFHVIILQLESKR